MSLFGYVLLLEQWTVVGLLIIGLEFLFIGLRLREDRTFLLLGFSLVILCVMVSLDVFILMPAIPKKAGSMALLDALQLLYQILACAYVGAALWFTRSLTGRPGRAAARRGTAALALFAGIAVADIFHPDHLFIGFRDWRWVTTPFYDWVFMPCIIGIFAWILFLTALSLKAARPDARPTIRRLCIAYGFLLVGGIVDFLIVVFNLRYTPNAVLFGVLVFGIMAIFIFTEKLLSLYQEQRRRLLEIAGIHQAMEAQRPLGELGRSAAKVSHEIKNYVSQMKSESWLLRQPGAEAYRQEITRLENARHKLERYTLGILDFAKSSQVERSAPLRAGPFLRECLERRFPEASGRLRLRIGPAAAAPEASADGGALPADALIAADPAKLERAFFELIKNAWEAGAGSVEVRVQARPGLLLVAIEDDGEGIPREGGERILQPFYTTRKAEGACGLGASIAEGIIRGHGGMIRVYPKAAGWGMGGRGLLLNVLVPRAGAGPIGEAGDECLLVSERNPLIKDFFSMCANLGLRATVARPGEAWGRLAARARLVVVDGEAAVSRLGAAGARAFACGEGNLLSAARGAAGPALPLCEETLLRLLERAG